MKKKIKVLITSNNIHKAEYGSISSVTRGYAFNYLIPNKYAEIPSKKRLRHIQMFNEIKNQQNKEQETKSKIFQKRIEQIKKVSIYRKIGENNLIFGSITERDINKWFSFNTNLKLHKNKIIIQDNKSTGKKETSIEIKHNKNIVLQMNIIPINI